MRLIIERDDDRDIARIKTDADEVPEVFVAQEGKAWEIAVERITTPEFDKLLEQVTLPELTLDIGRGMCNYCGASVPLGAVACAECDGPPPPRRQADAVTSYAKA